MINCIHIVGASGAGTSTLGQALEREYGYKWMDTDNYFWFPTDPPFNQARPREERAALMATEIQKHPKCVISGSLCGWGDVFIPQFDLVVFVDTPTDIRIERLQKREYERFGERICEVGDMYEEHRAFIEWARTYDTAGIDQRSRTLHEEWFRLLKCPLMRIDGTKPVEQVLEETVITGNIIDFDNILPRFFGTSRPPSISHIYRNAWSIGDDYVLKSSGNQGEFDKSIQLNRLLLSEGIPVIEYIDTTECKPYVFADDRYWCLMKRIKGTVFDPYVGDPKQNGFILGKAVAELHQALKCIEDKTDIHEADFHNEFISWILPELERGGISLADGVIDSLHAFFEQDYRLLPRQLIHRDMHTSNLLFEENVLTGYLDFDLCQRNVRIFDIVYLGCSQLVENYMDIARLAMWREIFSGVFQGYNELLPLNEEEMNAILPLFLFDQVLFTAFYLKIGQLETAKSCLEMINWMYENMAFLFKSFTQA